MVAIWRSDLAHHHPDETMVLVPSTSTKLRQPSRIPRGSDQNDDLILFPSLSHGLHKKMWQYLKCHILEGAGGTVPEL